MKFLFPLIINEPVGKNYPVGADFDTWSWYTHQADDIILVSHAFDLQTVNMAASSKVMWGGRPALGGPLITVEAAPP